MAKKRKARVAYVHCAGGATLLEGIERETLPQDCAAILEAHPNGIQTCRFGCLGGGSCVAACKVGAIALNERGVAEVNDDKCIGCGLCAKACPQQLIEVVPTENAIRTRCGNRDLGPAARKACANSCIACGMCERVCPAGAIHVIDGRAQIDQARCIACGMCASKCPRGVIRDINGIITVG